MNRGKRGKEREREKRKNPNLFTPPPLYSSTEITN